MAFWRKKTRRASSPSADPALAGETAGEELGPRTVTDVALQTRSGLERVNVFLDGEYGFSLAADIGAGLREGQVLDAAAIRELLARDKGERAYQHALQYLAARPRSTAEIRRRLTEHSHSPEAIAVALERLGNHGYVDDRAFADYWVGQRQTFHPRGPRALRAELRQKGVDAETTTAALEPTVADQEDAAYRAGVRRAQRAPLDERAFTQAMTPFLVRRGFDYGAVRTAVRRLWDERNGAGATEAGATEE
jgi:regulatory protein